MNKDFYTTKEPLIGYIRYYCEQTDRLHKFDSLYVSSILYLLQVNYVANFNVKEQIGIIEQDNFYPKYLFDYQFTANLYGVVDKSIELDNIVSMPFGDVSNKFELKIVEFIIETIKNCLEVEFYQLIDKIHDCPAWHDAYWSMNSTITYELIDKYYRK